MSALNGRLAILGHMVRKEVTGADFRARWLR